MTEQGEQVRRIICLANSRKLSGRCIAGVTVESGSPRHWVRPVSARATEELTLEEIRLDNGRIPSLLDILEIPIAGPHPHGCQVENERIEPHGKWKWLGRFPRAEVGELLEEVPSLWIDGHRTLAGRNDRIPVEDSDRVPGSLVLVRPRWLRLHLIRRAPRVRVRAQFALAGGVYNLVVTDPLVEAACVRLDREVLPMWPETAICVSLGEPFEGYRYKLVAAVIDCRPEAEDE